MYFCDSPRRRIMQCDYDAESARVSNVREFADLASHPGFPDGSTRRCGGRSVERGVGRVDGAAVHAEGRVDRQLAVPAKNPSCVAFGGPNLDDVITDTEMHDLVAYLVSLK